MLAENIGVHIGLVNIEIFGKSGSQPCGVQNRTRTDDVVVGKTGHLVECVGQNVHRVADDDINGIGRIFGDFGDDGLCDVHIGLSQLQSGLTGLPGNTGG